MIGRRLYPSIFVQYCSEREAIDRKTSMAFDAYVLELGLKHTELDCSHSISMMEAYELIQSWSSCETGDQITLIQSFCFFYGCAHQL